MSAAEFIIKNKIDLFNAHGNLSDTQGNMLIETPIFWVFVANDGHFEKVYL